MTDLEKTLPLPNDACICAIARYVGDMRELVQYDIKFDGYLVRHDWMQDGQRMTNCGRDIQWYEALYPDALDAAVLERRQACLTQRGIA